MRKIYCFGNEDFKDDEIAINLGKKLSKSNILTNKFEFIIAYSPNEILNSKQELIILDVAKGTKTVQILNNIDDLTLSNSVTCHDLDLGFYLKLLKETGQITNVKIIALPFGINDYDYLEKKVIEILEKI